MSKSMRWTEEQYQAHLQKTAGVGARSRGGHPHAPGRATPAPAVSISKYGSRKTVVDGIRFDSRREARYYEQLQLRLKAGEIAGFIRQVSIPLHKSRRRMRIDFLVFELDGRPRWIDVKGYATEAWQVKRDEVEANYPIKVELA